MLVSFILAEALLKVKLPYAGVEFHIVRDQLGGWRWKEESAQHGVDDGQLLCRIRPRFIVGRVGLHTAAFLVILCGEKV